MNSNKNTLSNTDRLLQSFNNQTRYFVLECAVCMEEKASDTLSRLLGISSKKSKSLGYGSISLGFNNKITLIQDMKEVKTDSRDKFNSFMSIRNKFAHIAEIDSFKTYFEIIEQAKDQKNKFKRWFPDLQWNSDDSERIYKIAFLLLTLDLFQTFIEIDLKHAYEKGKSAGVITSQEVFIDNIKSQLEKTDEGREILDYAFKKNINHKILL